MGSRKSRPDPGNCDIKKRYTIINYFCFFFFCQVNINPAYRPTELKYALNKVGVKCLVASESFKNVSYYGILDEILPELSASKDCGYINSKAVPSLESLVMVSDKDHRGTFSFKNIFESAGPEASAQVQRRQDVIQFDDPANIQFTSVISRRFI